MDEIITGAIGSLNLFNEKAKRLDELSFTRQLTEPSSGITFSWKEGNPLTIERLGPNDEAIEAFVLTLRFFIQDNEKISLGNFAKLYTSLPIELEIIENFNKARDALNDFLDNQKSFLSINNRQYTFREIFEVFMWGGLAHANVQNKEIFDSWRRNPFIFTILQNEFVYAIGKMLQVIFYIAHLNEQILESLKSRRDCV